MFRAFRKISAWFPSTIYNHINYYYLHFKKGIFPKIINLKNPQTFNEKIIWLKLNYKYTDAKKYADKYAVRSFVKEKIGEKYLIPALGVFKKIQDIDYGKLPSKFVLKPNHGSGWVIICKDKNEFDINKSNSKLKEWLAIDYYDIGKEYQYKGISPKIIAEEFLEESDGTEIKDYKFFCLNGIPKFVQVDMDRHSGHKRNFYDLDWNLQEFEMLYPKSKEKVAKPQNLDKMIEVSSILSKGFVFSRIDLYSVNGRIYFGETTFHPEGGFGPIFPKKYAKILGDMITLPKKQK